MPDKEFYWIVTCADPDPGAAETTLECFRGFAACLEGSSEKGVIYGTGLYEAGAVRGEDVLQEAYQMGRGV